MMGRKSRWVVLVGCSVLFGCNNGATDSRLAGSHSGGSNHPPSILSAHLPDPLTRSGPVAVSISAEDRDHDTITFQYKWSVNDMVVADETVAQFPPEKIRRDDRLSVEIIPSDGRSHGASYKTPSVQVGNTVPFVTKAGF